MKLTVKEQEQLSPATVARLRELAPDMLARGIVQRVVRKIRKRIHYINWEWHSLRIFRVHGRVTGKVACRVSVGPLWIRRMEGKGIDVGIRGKGKVRLGGGGK
jgi:hypothetical protein